MLALFHGNRPIVMALLPFLAGSFVLLNLFFPFHEIQLANFGFWGTFDIGTTWYSQTIAPLLSLLCAVLLNLGFNRDAFFERNTYLISLLYLVLASFFDSFYYLNGFSLVQVLFVMMLFQISLLNQHKDARKTAFNLAFFGGLASTIYPLFAFVFPFLFIILWVFRSFIVREGMLVFVGFFLPLLYARTYLMFIGVESTPEDFSVTPMNNYANYLTILGGLVFFLILLSLKLFFRKINQGSIRMRKLYRILFILAVLVLVLSFGEYLIYGKIQALMLLLPLLMFILPFAFGDQNKRSIAYFTFYLIYFLSIAKFFVETLG